MKAKIELEGGKYTVIDELGEGGGFYALRHGEDWRNLDGDGLVYAMFCEVERQKAEIERLNSSVEYSKRLVGNLFHENAVLKGEKPITVHLNGGDSE